MTDDDDLRELLDLMRDPAPVPDRYVAELWDELEPSLDTTQVADDRAAAISIGERTDGGPVLTAPPVGESGRPRRWLIAAAAAAVIVIVVGFLVTRNGTNETIETDDLAGLDTGQTTTTVPEAVDTTLPDQRIIDDPPATDEAPAFTRAVQVAQIGNTFLRVRFATQTDTAYTAVVATGDQIVEAVSGSASADELADVTVQNLTPGTLYTVQVTLIGPPTATSPLIEIRTAGGDPVADGPGETVELLDPRVTALAPTQFRVDYESNICANGTFVIFEENGPEVGRNEGQPEGCTTQHLAVPGQWTEPLRPNTTYVITITVEANGAGLGNGNTDSQSLTVTTAQVASEQVEVLDLRLVDVGPTHVEAAYRSNVCANGSFVVTTIDGTEVGSNDGLPSGCGTEHLSMPGVWTPELEPNTAYMLTVTLEANGAGLGDGNVASESIEFLTATG